MEILMSRKFSAFSSAFLYILSFAFSLTLFYSMGNNSISETNDYYQFQPGIKTVIDIFSKNIIVVFLMISGIFTFGIITILILILNGFWLGGAVAFLLSENNSLDFILMSIIPHGLFEIPGLLIAGYIGLNGIQFYLKPLMTIRESLKPFFFCVILIFLAAIVEGLYTFGLKNSF